MINQQAKDLLAGKYGQTVKPFNPEVQKKLSVMQNLLHADLQIC